MCGSRVPHSFAGFANEWAVRAALLVKLLYRTAFNFHRYEKKPAARGIGDPIFSLESVRSVGAASRVCAALR